MSYSISFRVSFEEKSDKIWKKIANGTYMTEVKKELNEIAKQKAEIEKDPKSIIDSKLLNQWSQLEIRESSLDLIISDIEYLQEHIETNNVTDIKEAIASIDEELGDLLQYPALTLSLHPSYEFFEYLFMIVLGKESVEGHDTLSQIPFDSWVALFQKIDVASVKKAISATEDDPNDKNAQNYYIGIIREIRNMIKQCLDNKGIFIVVDELSEYNEQKSPTKKQRIKNIYRSYFEK